MLIVCEWPWPNHFLRYAFVLLTKRSQEYFYTLIRSLVSAYPSTFSKAAWFRCNFCRAILIIPSSWYLPPSTKRFSPTAQLGFGWDGRKEQAFVRLWCAQLARPSLTDPIPTDPTQKANIGIPVGARFSLGLPLLLEQISAVIVSETSLARLTACVPTP